MSGILTVVGTPLGNLGDMSPRAVEALRQADFIAAEDTRVTLKLLNHFEIKKPMISYFEHNRKFHGELICQKIEAGENCALVSDAGMPAISDPGEDLVRLCGERGITVSVVPGPSALIAALAVSGLPTGRFTFEGFLSMNKKSRRDHLEQVKNETRTMIFYEAPHKLLTTLEDMQVAFGADRPICLCRELTKLHEEAVKTTLGQALSYYRENSPRGEYVLIVGGAAPKVLEAPSMEDCIARVSALRDTGLSMKDAVKQVSKESGIPRNTLYDAALQAQNQ